MIVVLACSISFGLVHWSLSLIQKLPSSVALACAFFVALLLYHFRDNVITVALWLL
jgi:hypothetical protein